MEGGDRGNVMLLRRSREISWLPLYSYHTKFNIGIKSFFKFLAFYSCVDIGPNNDMPPHPPPPKNI